MTTPVARQFHQRTALPASREKDVADAAPVSRLDRVRLKDGTQVGIRLLEVADREALVEDAWQQRGLGRMFFERLIALAESRGLRVFVACVHWNNVRTIRALDRLATILDRRMEAGVLKFIFTRSPGA
jgi:GNAT superfamily N-acetyltransferase